MTPDNTKTILVAEDDPFLLKAIAKSLEKKGLTVVQAVDGEQAIEKMDAQQPDLLLLDILMPKVDGYEVLEHMDQKKYQFPVVILSNLSEEISSQKCSDICHCVDYIVKSDIDQNELYEKLLKHL